MEFLTTTKAAKRLGVSSETVRTLCRKGELPAYKIGGHFKVEAGELDGWLDKQRIEKAEETIVERAPKAKQADRPLVFSNLPGFEI
jgi:excisionase family DNA binding protein